MSIDDNDGQMIFGDPGGLKIPYICLTGEEKPPKKKTSPRKLVPTGNRTWAHCVTGEHGQITPLLLVTGVTIFLDILFISLS